MFSDIYNFLQVVLGTESGMVTAIVRKVQAMLQASGRKDIAVEIVFPVASEAITTDTSARPSPAQNGNGSGVVLPGGLPVVPGPAGGEGCSAEGGCASCPYMKVSFRTIAITMLSELFVPVQYFFQALEGLDIQPALFQHLGAVVLWVNFG